MPGIGQTISALSHHMLINGVASGGTTRRNLELAVDGGEVPVDCARADDELLGDLSVGEALCDKTQHLHLTGSQAGRIRGMPCGKGRSGSRRALRLLREPSR